MQTGDRYMNTLVMIVTNEDGEEEEPLWHAINPHADDLMVLCSGQYFGDGASECTYKTKDIIRGGISCPKCVEIIKFYKSIKL